MRATTDIIMQEARRIWSIKWIRMILSLFMSLFVLAFLIFYASKSIKDLQQIWPQIRPTVLLMTLPVYILAALIAAFLWSKVVRGFGAPFSDWFNIRVYLLTLAARRLPGSLLHVVGRVALYKKNGIGAKTLSFVSVVEIALIIWSGLLVSLCSWLFFSQVHVSRIEWLVLSIILFTILLHPKVIRLLFVKLTNDKSAFSIDYSTILGWLLGHIALWFVGAFILFLIIYAIYPLNMSIWLLALVAWSLSGVGGMLVTFLPSGLGVQEVTMSLILGQFMPSSVAVSIALVARILLTFYDFLVSLVIWGFERRNNTNGLLK